MKEVKIAEIKNYIYGMDEAIRTGCYSLFGFAITDYLGYNNAFDGEKFKDDLAEFKNKLLASCILDDHEASEDVIKWIDESKADLYIIGFGDQTDEGLIASIVVHLKELDYYDLESYEYRLAFCKKNS